MQPMGMETKIGAEYAIPGMHRANTELYQARTGFPHHATKSQEIQAGKVVSFVDRIST
jgi:hypothetical protein